MSAKPIDPVEHVHGLLAGWTPPPPDPVEEAETADMLARQFNDPDFTVESLRSMREPYTLTDDEARETLAHQITHDLHELATLPGPRHWTRWKATRRLASFLYVTGITSSGGSTSWGGLDPYGARYELPRLADVLPAKYGRPYILWMDRKFRDCARLQLAYALRLRRPAGGWHRPGRSDVYGICGRCAPWHCCGSTTHEHPVDCPEQGDHEAVAS